MHPKAKLQNAPTFTGNGSHAHVCLLLVIKIKTCIYQMCKRQSADTNVLIGRYRLSVHLLRNATFEFHEGVFDHVNSVAQNVHYVCSA